MARFGSARAIAGLAIIAALLPASAAELRVIRGLKNPESAVAGPDGRVYVSEIGEFGKDGDGRITVIDAHGKASTFAGGLNDPKGLAFWKRDLFVTDRDRVLRIDSNGKVSVFADAARFPQAPRFLNDPAFDSRGHLFVSDSGDVNNGGQGAIFRISADGAVSLVISEQDNPSIKSPNGLLFEQPGKLLVLDLASGELLRLNVENKTTEIIAGGFGVGDGIARDAAGMLYLSDWKAGTVWKLDARKHGARPQAYKTRFRSAADIGIDASGRYILVPDMLAGTLTWLPK